MLAGFPVVEGKLLNPLREDDNTPGCFYEWFEYTDGTKVLYFYDFTGYFGKNGVNAVEVLQETTGITDYRRLYYWIKHHLGKTDFEAIPLPEVETYDIDIKYDRREWTQYNYFSQYFIPTFALDREGVVWCGEYWCNTRRNPNMIKNLLGDPFKTPIIAYTFGERTKLYNPYAGKRGIKWYGNINSDDIWGYDTFDRDSDYVIITKSGKDFLVIKYVLGYECIAIQSEGARNLPKVLELTEDRKAFVLFDTDNTGVERSKFLHEEYGWEPLHLPQLKNCTDTSDIIQHFGYRYVRDIFDTFKIGKYDKDKKRLENIF